MKTYTLTVDIKENDTGFFTIARKDILSLEQLQALLLEYSTDYPEFNMLNFAIDQS